jgi:hypothetical protein
MSEVTSVLAPIAVHFAAIFAAGATVALLASVSERQLVGVQRDDE